MDSIRQMLSVDSFAKNDRNFKELSVHTTNKQSSGAVQFAAAPGTALAPGEFR